MILDTKPILHDLFSFFKSDDKESDSESLTTTELINGYLNLLELFEVEIKEEFRENIANIAEIIRTANAAEFRLPKCKETHSYSSSKSTTYLIQ